MSFGVPEKASVVVNYDLFHGIEIKPSIVVADTLHLPHLANVYFAFTLNNEHKATHF